MRSTAVNRPGFHRGTRRRKPPAHHGPWQESPGNGGLCFVGPRTCQGRRGTCGHPGLAHSLGRQCSALPFLFSLFLRERHGTCCFFDFSAYYISFLHLKHFNGKPQSQILRCSSFFLKKMIHIYLLKVIESSTYQNELSSTFINKSSRTSSSFNGKLKIKYSH
jgi:hypothetical protein